MGGDDPCWRSAFWRASPAGPGKPTRPSWSTPVSNSGRSRDLLDVADIAHKQGATVIVITASGSPLAHLAQQPGHVLLAADHPEDFDRYSPMVSRLLHLMIIDILTTGVALRLGSDKLRPMLQEIKRNLRTRRYASDV